MISLKDEGPISGFVVVIRKDTLSRFSHTGSLFKEPVHTVHHGMAEIILLADASQGLSSGDRGSSGTNKPWPSRCTGSTRVTVIYTSRLCLMYASIQVGMLFLFMSVLLITRTPRVITHQLFQQAYIGCFNYQ